MNESIEHTGSGVSFKRAIYWTFLGWLNGFFMGFLVAGLYGCGDSERSAACSPVGTHALEIVDQGGDCFGPMEPFTATLTVSPDGEGFRVKLDDARLTERWEPSVCTLTGYNDALEIELDFSGSSPSGFGGYLSTITGESCYQEFEIGGQ